jgi:hypothetical protein
MITHSNISKENTEVILKSIISDNKSLYKKIQEIFSELNTKQACAILLLKLGYTFHEIILILDVSDKNITEAYELLINSNLK